MGKKSRAALAALVLSVPFLCLDARAAGHGAGEGPEFRERSAPVETAGPDGNSAEAGFALGVVTAGIVWVRFRARR